MKYKKYLFLLCSFCILFTACNAPAQPDTSESAEESSETEEISLTETETETETSYFSTDPPPTEAPRPESVYLSHPDSVEVNTNLTASTFITYSNVTLKDPVMKIDTGEIGTYEVTIPYYYGTEVREETITYQVRDTTPPVIVNNGEHAYVKTGEEFDPRKLIGYGDNYDTNISFTYDGEVNTAVPGIYMMSAYLTDQSGNQSVCRFSVTVADEKPTSPNTHEAVRFSDLKNQFLNQENISFGVDVSSWQGEINFKALKDAGCDFVIIRIGKGIDEYISQDDNFAQNIQNAKAAGLKVGVYFYTTDNSILQIRADADWIADTLGNQKLDFPVGFDWEDFETFQDYDINFYELNLIYQSFAEELNQRGYDTMLYSTKENLQNVWATVKTDKIWLADYAYSPENVQNYYMWQRTDTGSIDGIDGNADLNVFRQSDYLMQSASETELDPNQ